MNSTAEEKTSALCNSNYSTYLFAEQCQGLLCHLCDVSPCDIWVEEGRCRAGRSQWWLGIEATDSASWCVGHFTHLSRPPPHAKQTQIALINNPLPRHWWQVGRRGEFPHNYSKGESFENDMQWRLNITCQYGPTSMWKRPHCTDAGHTVLHITLSASQIVPYSLYSAVHLTRALWPWSHVNMPPKICWGSCLAPPPCERDNNVLKLDTVL